MLATTETKQLKARLESAERELANGAYGYRYTELSTLVQDLKAELFRMGLR